MKKLVSTLARLGAMGLLVTPLAAQVTGFEELRREAHQELVSGLEEFSDWCRSKKLYLSRLEALNLLLELDPTHEDSLKSLGFRRGRDGTWTPPKKPKKFKDFNEKAAEEVPERFEDAIDPYLASLHGLLGNPELSRDQRLLVMQDILLVDPEDAFMREELGEVKLDGSWVLAESSDYLDNQRRLAGVLERAASELGTPREVPPNRTEQTVGLEWSQVVETPVARVVGTGDPAELHAVAVSLAQALELVREFIQPSARPPLGLTVFVLQGADERDTFLENYPGLEDEARARMAEHTSAWIDGNNHVANWMPTPEERLDGIVRLFVSQVLGEAVRVGLDKAWLHEGLGLYLTELVAGTRLTWFVQPPEQEIDGLSLRSRLTASADWKKDAALVFRDGREPRVAVLIAKELAAFELTDLLHAYLWTAYLFEAHPGAIAPVVRSIGLGKDPRSTIEDALERPLDELDGRVLRWLGETGFGVSTAREAHAQRGG